MRQEKQEFKIVLSYTVLEQPGLHEILSKEREGKRGREGGGINNPKHNVFFPPKMVF